MPEPFAIAYFGLPLGAYLLARDGCRLDPCVLSPIEAPGRRRVSQAFGAAVIDALELEAEPLELLVEQAFERARPELLVSWFWTRLLPERWLGRCPRGAIGVHPSLLPRHRGPNPYFWAIDAGDELTGVTLHRLSAEYDRGAMLGQRRIAVGERNAWQLARALDRPSLALLREGVRAIAQGEPPAGEPQDEPAATWAPEPSGDALRVSWSWPCQRILRRIRALSPVPGLALELYGVAFFATRAHQSARVIEALLPGEAALLENPATLIIRTADGAIAVDRAVLAGSHLSDTPDGAETSDEPSELDGAKLAELLLEARRASA